ncbi:hypothetical protein V6N13_070332 [Hibiscus sabdariffa]|uniref:Uncharacterized protein n=1 Tax=Hibiscus sabdariffa TaxID=183260 RepID=A0ABR2TGQ8_9ROSI
MSPKYVVSNPNTTQFSTFQCFADCGKRVDPPMPDSYFGNLIQAIFTVTAAGLLLANPLDIEGVRSGSNNRFEEIVYLYQGKSGGRRIDVEITSKAQAMEKLEKDKRVSHMEVQFCMIKYESLNG